MHPQQSWNLITAMLDQFTHLSRFQAIVEEGSLRQAGKRLNLTQPALSRSLALLEASFGRPLLERHARGVKPTAFGERVLITARRLGRQWDIAYGELATDPTDQRVTMRLGLGPIWRSGLLAPVFKAMRQRHPNILFEVSPLREDRALADLDEGRLDVVLGGNRIDPRESPNLVRCALTTNTIQICAREGHPAFDHLLPGDPNSERCLLDFPWIIYTEMGVYTHEGDNTVAARLGREPDVWMKSSSLMTILSTLQHSDSLCLLSDLSVQALENPRVLPLPVEWRRRTIPLGIVHRKELTDWTMMQDFVALCRQQLA